jgi:hypothetical protein
MTHGTDGIDHHARVAMPHERSRANAALLTGVDEQ